MIKYTIKLEDIITVRQKYRKLENIEWSSKKQMND